MKHTFLFLTLICLLNTTLCFAQNEDAMHPKWDKYHSSIEANALLEDWAKAQRISIDDA